MSVAEDSHIALVTISILAHSSWSLGSNLNLKPVAKATRAKVVQGFLRLNNMSVKLSIRVCFMTSEKFGHTLTNSFLFQLFIKH